MKISQHYKYQLKLPNKPMYQILPNLYIGGADASENTEYLKKNGINHVINCAEEIRVCHDAPILSWNYAFEDSPFFPIHAYFSETSNLIHGILSKPNNKVLIACAMGINRSMSILCAYLFSIARENVTMNDIIDEIADVRRSCMLTNNSFYRQLINLKR